MSYKKNNQIRLASSDQHVIGEAGCDSVLVAKDRTNFEMETMLLHFCFPESGWEKFSSILNFQTKHKDQCG